MKRKMCGRPLLSCLLAVLLCIGAAPAQAAETPASEKSGAVNWVETVDEGILPEPVEIPILMYHNLVAEEDDPSISKNTMWVGQFQHQMELLEENGIVGPFAGSNPREVLPADEPDDVEGSDDE